MTRCPVCGGRAGRGAHAACGQVFGGAEAGATATGTLRERVPGFELVAPIGQGGFGAVYRARQLRDGAPAAVKIAEAREPSAAIRLRREAVVLAEVGPPHVPRLLDSRRSPLRHALRRDGAHRPPHPRRADGRAGRSARAGRGLAARASARERAGRAAPARLRPPRPQAREHLRRHRQGRADRFRACPGKFG